MSALSHRYGRARGTLTDKQRSVLATADADGFIEPMNTAAGFVADFRILDGLAKRGYLVHYGHVAGQEGYGPIPGPDRRTKGDQYGRIHRHSRVSREDIFRLTADGRAAAKRA